MVKRTIEFTIICDNPKCNYGLGCGNGLIFKGDSIRDAKIYGWIIDGDKTYCCPGCAKEGGLDG